MKPLLCTGLALSVATFGLSALAEDRFAWSWEKDGARGTSQPPAAAAADAARPAAPAPAVRSEKPATPPAGVTPKAYEELLKENVDLRRQAAEQKREADVARADGAKLARDLKEMDQRLAQMGETVQRLQKEKVAAETKAGEAALKAPPPAPAPAAPAIDRSVAEELAALRKLVAELKAQKPAAVATDQVPPGSPLYQDLERKNVLLEEKLVEVDRERTRAVQLGEQTKLRADRIQQKAEETERAMRVEVVELKTTLAEREAALRVRSKEIESLQAALEKEKRRAVTAEQTARQADIVRAEVAQVSDKQSRDLHYNMAVVYAKEGKFAEAEREYLAALQADPSDPDIHYNLGILYDDDLKQPDKAAIHYRRYLKLSPNAPDGDTVREWLMRIERPRGR